MLTWPASELRVARHGQARHAHRQQHQQVDQPVLLYASFHEKS